MFSEKITALSGQRVTFECVPSDDSFQLYWTYQTVNVNGTVTTTNISQSKYLIGSPQFHHLILPIATVDDTGEYSCIVHSNINTTISQTISVTVLPGKCIVILLYLCSY